MSKDKKYENQNVQYNMEKFKAFKQDWNQLLALLLQGNSIIADTPVELEFLRKYVDDPIDTLMELKEHKDSEFIQALKGFAEKPYDDKIKKVAKHLLEDLEEDAPDNENTLRLRS